MEYLMTYGWAILLISVAIMALYGFGVFNYNNLVQKQLPGSYWIYRPNGPGSTIDISASGVCTGLPPQSVARFNGNGYIAHGSLVVPVSKSCCNQETVTAWVNPSSYASALSGETAVSVGYAAGSDGDIELDLNASGTHEAAFYKFAYGIGGTTCYAISSADSTAKLNNWYFLAGVENSIGVALYINGVYNAAQGDVCSASSGSSAMDSGSNTVIGDIPAVGTYPFNGEIANVQIYNTSLSANQIEALYVEGIGGAPINLQKLAAWYPLNGNSNDYSGNQNNATAVSVQYTTNWQGNYTQP